MAIIMGLGLRLFKVQVASGVEVLVVLSLMVRLTEAEPGQSVDRPGGRRQNHE